MSSPSARITLDAGLVPDLEIRAQHIDSDHAQLAILVPYIGADGVRRFFCRIVELNPAEQAAYQQHVEKIRGAFTRANSDICTINFTKGQVQYANREFEVIEHSCKEVEEIRKLLKAHDQGKFKGLLNWHSYAPNSFGNSNNPIALFAKHEEKPSKRLEQLRAEPRPKLLEMGLHLSSEDHRKIAQVDAFFEASQNWFTQRIAELEARRTANQTTLAHDELEFLSQEVDLYKSWNREIQACDRFAIYYAIVRQEQLSARTGLVQRIEERQQEVANLLRGIEPKGWFGRAKDLKPHEEEYAKDVATLCLGNRSNYVRYSNETGQTPKQDSIECAILHAVQMGWQPEEFFKHPLLARMPEVLRAEYQNRVLSNPALTARPVVPHLDPDEDP